MCGKYGEYIDDETDHDLCSVECLDVVRADQEFWNEQASYASDATGDNDDSFDSDGDFDDDDDDDDDEEEEEEEGDSAG